MRQFSEVFKYKDGKLYWIDGARSGKEAGAIIRSTQRWCINLKKRKYLRSRVVWMMHNGEIPDGYEIDHIDHDTLNDRIENLRIVTRGENAKNLSKRVDNTSGITGVTFCKRDRLWQAKIHVKGKCVSLGHFKEMQDAVEARRLGEIKYRYHENHGK